MLWLTSWNFARCNVCRPWIATNQMKWTRRTNRLFPGAYTRPFYAARPMQPNGLIVHAETLFQLTFSIDREWFQHKHGRHDIQQTLRPNLEFALYIYERRASTPCVPFSSKPFCACVHPNVSIDVAIVCPQSFQLQIFPYYAASVYSQRIIWNASRASADCIAWILYVLLLYTMRICSLMSER